MNKENRMNRNEWSLLADDTFNKKFKKFEKKHPNESRALLDNLHTYFNELNQSRHPTLIKAGFIHPEGGGIVAIDQSGRGKMKQVRLYIYPDLDKQELHLITIGDKTTQRQDIQYCRKHLLEKALRKEA